MGGRGGRNEGRGDEGGEEEEGGMLKEGRKRGRKRRAHLPGSLAEDSIDEGHDGRLQVDLVSIATSTPVQVVQQSLETGERE